VDWIQLTQDTLKWRVVVKTVVNRLVIGRLSDCHHLKAGTAPRSCIKS